MKPVCSVIGIECRRQDLAVLCVGTFCTIVTSTRHTARMWVAVLVPLGALILGLRAMRKGHAFWDERLGR